MISLSHTRYGSRFSRHGNSRAFAENQRNNRRRKAVFQEEDQATGAAADAAFRAMFSRVAPICPPSMTRGVHRSAAAYGRAAQSRLKRQRTDRGFRSDDL